VREHRDGVEVLRTWVFAAANRGRMLRSVSFTSFAASTVAWGQWFSTRPDVLIATSPQILGALAGLCVSLLRRVPLVLEIRDLWPESIVAVGALRESHPIIKSLRVVESTLYRAAASIVVVTDSFRDYLLTRGIDDSKIEVVKNGVDLARFTPRAHNTPLRRELNWQSNFVVGYVGTHGMAHRLDRLLDVAVLLTKERANVRFLFAGEGAERQALEQRARHENLHNVVFLGSRQREEMPDTYASCDALIVPLRKTDLFKTVIPSKIFEIMAMKRPLILAVDGEARNLVEQSGGGIFVPPEDVEAIAAAITSLEQNPQQRQKMGEAGRAFVETHFDRTKLAARYLALLEKHTHSS
jgi:colanic acid biosynthesis glycosyl transferase WcaI